MLMKLCFLSSPRLDNTACPAFHPLQYGSVWLTRSAKFPAEISVAHGSGKVSLKIDPVVYAKWPIRKMGSYRKL
jgi:hypothetical protein